MNRRDFLLGSAALTTTLAVPAVDSFADELVYHKPYLIYYMWPDPKADIWFYSSANGTHGGTISCVYAEECGGFRKAIEQIENKQNVALITWPRDPWIYDSPGVRPNMQFPPDYFDGVYGSVGM